MTMTCALTHIYSPLCATGFVESLLLPNCFPGGVGVAASLPSQVSVLTALTRLDLTGNKLVRS